jgi:hypothetical protein
MSIWNKVLLWLIGLASLGFLILAAHTLQTHSFWMATAQKLEKSLGDEMQKTGLRGENRALKADVEKELLELHKLLVDRPQVWSNCTVQVNINKPKATAAIVAAIEMPVDAAGKPAPHGIAASSTLYAFEEPTAENPGRYLGEFNVTKAEEKQIALQPAYPLGQLDQKKLDDAKGRLWTFYNVLPQDNHEAFAQLTDEQKKSLSPPGAPAEYFKDGKPADPQDPKERIDAQGKYVRQLRDYAQLLNNARQQNTILFDESEATKRDKALIEESLADAQRQVQFSQNAITELKTLLAKKEKERNAVANLRTLLKDKLASIEGKIKDLIEDNKAKAGQIAQKQIEATREIDARTRAMAQAASEKK